jgi:hypothetical protein
MKTTRTRAFFLALRIALLGIGVLLGLGLVQPAAAQQNLVDDSGVINLYDPYCLAGGPDDGCNLESFAVIYDTTTGSSLDVVDQTSVSLDSFDDGYNAFVCGYIYQDGALYASGCIGDNGNGVAAVGGSVAINTTNGPHQYTVHTDSYYDYYVNGGCEGGGSCYFITSTQVAAWIGPPRVTSVSPAYVFVGTSGTITIGGQALVNPFGAGSTTVMAVPAVTGATGLTLSANSFTATQGTANSQATLTATTGPWDIGLGTELGGTFYSSTTKGLFTVGDPPPSISSVSPNQWTAGQTNIAVTISGSYFGSNPQLTLVGAGATSSITSHTDTGQPGGAQIHANVSVPNTCADGSVVITVTSTGYNGTGFTPAYSGESSSATASATIIPVARAGPMAVGDAPYIIFNGKQAQGVTTIVNVGEPIFLTGQVPVQACVQVASQQWAFTSPHGTAVGDATATKDAGFTVDPAPSDTTNMTYGIFYWVYPGTFSITYHYTLVNGVQSPTSTATFKVVGKGSMSNKPYSKLTADNLAACGGLPAEPWMVYGNVTSSKTKPCADAYPGSTFGMVFTPSGAPSGGTYSYVQLINSDTYTQGNNCTTSQGVDGGYPYTAILPGTSPPQAADAPALSGPPYNSLDRSFNATMFLLWTSKVVNSIPVPMGYQTWAFDGSATCSAAKNCYQATNWPVTTNGKPGPLGNYTPSNGSQTTDGYSVLIEGYPYWPAPAESTCN